MRIVVNRTERKSIAYSLEPEKLTILIPREMSSNFQIDDILSAINGNIELKEILTIEEFHKLVNEWTEKLQIKPGRVRIRRMKNKWASCSPGKGILFNSLLISMPKEFAAYVICHELLHFKVPNHNKLFKDLLSAYMPDWRERISRTIDYLLKQKERTDNLTICKVPRRFG